MIAQEIYILTKEELEEYARAYCSYLESISEACDKNPVDFEKEISEINRPELPPPVVVPRTYEILRKCCAEYSTNIGQIAYEEGANFILQKLGLKK